MADPHVILAPIVEPPLPPLPASAPAPAILPLVLAGAALVLLALAGWALWRRGTGQRALRRIARHPEARQAAQQLARWQPRHWPQAPQAWLQALERFRFGPADAAAPAALQRLCAEARQAGRAR